MPRDVAQFLENMTTIVVEGDRLTAGPSQGGWGAGFGFFGGHDSFVFGTQSRAGDFVGVGEGSQPTPEEEDNEIVVEGNRLTDPFPLTNREFMDAIRQLLDNLDAAYIGDYRLQLEVGSAILDVFNYWEGTLDRYYLSTNGGMVRSESLPSPEVFELPEGFRQSGPDSGLKSYHFNDL